MATMLRPSTPPPTSSIRVPPTPKHGFDDDYQPYSPRKSARLSSKLQRDAQTPPPQSRSVGRASTSSMTDSSPPTSPQTAKKKASPKLSSTYGGRRVSGGLDDRSTASAAAALGMPVQRRDSKMEVRRSTASAYGYGMLPTPDKTPRKESAEFSVGITAIARNLFSTRPETADEAMPTPKRKTRNRILGFSMSEDEENEPIQVWTDSCERRPEVDRRPENPFLDNDSTAMPEPTKRKSKREMILIPGVGDVTIEEAQARTDGAIYTFRGKKRWLKYSNDGPTTRSQLVPRRLFTKAPADVTEDEEEAATDIEELGRPSTPVDHGDDCTSTPKAPKFAPASPPTTARATRSSKKFSSDDELSPTRAGRGDSGSGSPYGRWSRTKYASVQGKKRDGEPMSKAGSSKRIRG
ncbi:hypothetical protein BP5796_00286 [Coleophoma crateriformis]|uniref:Uncharacterized protein n=1 Tax=Coleophoma crateriformis TaxID=565419 RepID=A0A3D8T7H1_9HELO|nr:hypothetical protein BP5796_00286 [Coleophoma crateriformis]